MKWKNKKPTEIYCVEDLFKFTCMVVGICSTFVNIISPKIVDLFAEIFETELFVVYYDYRDYNPNFAKTHVKNALVPFKLNKKNTLFISKLMNIVLKIRKKYMTMMLDDYIDTYCNYAR